MTWPPTARAAPASTEDAAARAVGSGRRRRDRGDSLVEIVMTVVIVGATVTALIASLATAANASRTQRDGARADAVMRNFAEAAKAASKSCTPGASYQVAYTPPDGFTVAATPGDGICPAAHATQVLTLTVRGPSGLEDTMQIVLRTP